MNTVYDQMKTATGYRKKDLTRQYNRLWKELKEASLYMAERKRKNA
jgi:hypothetical protein